MKTIILQDKGDFEGAELQVAAYIFVRIEAHWHLELSKRQGPEVSFGQQ